MSTPPQVRSARGRHTQQTTTAVCSLVPPSRTRILALLAERGTTVCVRWRPGAAPQMRGGVQQRHHPQQQLQRRLVAAVMALMAVALAKGLVPAQRSLTTFAARARAVRLACAAAADNTHKAAAGVAAAQAPSTAAAQAEHQQQHQEQQVAAQSSSGNRRRRAEDVAGQQQQDEQQQPKEKKARPAPKPMKPKPNRSNLLVVGLGNPGDQYTMTRHNIGFLVADELARRWGFDMKAQTKFQGLYGSAQIRGKSVGVLKPTTFMNNSGQAARKVTDYFKLTAEHLLVLTDDVALDFGALRLRTKGSPGGHNGLKSMQAHMGTQDYARLRIGIGAPRQDLVGHVLGEFNRSEQKDLDAVVADAASVVEQWIAEDETTLVMTAINGRK